MKVDVYYVDGVVFSCYYRFYNDLDETVRDGMLMEMRWTNLFNMLRAKYLTYEQCIKIANGLAEHNNDDEQLFLPFDL